MVQPRLVDAAQSAVGRQIGARFAALHAIGCSLSCQTVLEIVYTCTIYRHSCTPKYPLHKFQVVRIRRCTVVRVMRIHVVLRGCIRIMGEH